VVIAMLNLVVLGNLALGFAPPSLTEPIVVTTPDTPSTIVTAGAATGVDAGGLYLNPSIELDYRFRSQWLFLHAKLVSGNNLGIDEGTNAGSRTAVTGGLEVRPCAFHGALCGIVGVDLGARYAYLDAEFDHRDGLAATLTQRAGFDVGTRHFRFRSDMQLTEETDGMGVALTAGLGYAW
jgi:hypothetical protein